LSRKIEVLECVSIKAGDRREKKFELRGKRMVKLVYEEMLMAVLENMISIASKDANVCK
jgi:hypothetical protein